MLDDEETTLNKKVIEKIRPHYIFNVLWNIQYLIKHDYKGAEKMLVDFSSYLRGKINDLCYEGLIPFDDEFEPTSAYIEIEKVRSFNNIKAKYDIQFTDFKIPSLVIQPLVENAIKHGLFANENEGTIFFSARKEGEKVVIVIQDDGAGFDINKLNPDKCGNLFKIEDRIRKYFPDGQVLIESKVGEGTKVTISYTYNKE